MFSKEFVNKINLSDSRDRMRWIRVEKRENKTHSFGKIGLKLKNDAEKVLKKNLMINEKTLQVEDFSNNQINQCQKCQKFEHLINICKETNAKCKYCAKNHDTRMYMYLIYKSKKSFSHISSKHANCNEAHVSNSSNCEHFCAIKIKSRKNKLVVLWVIKLLKKLDFVEFLLTD